MNACQKKKKKMNACHIANLISYQPHLFTLFFFISFYYLTSRKLVQGKTIENEI